MLFLAILQQNQYSYMQQTARIRIIYVDTWELKDILMLSSEEEKVWGHIRINNVSPIDYIQRTCTHYGNNTSGNNTQVLPQLLTGYSIRYLLSGTNFTAGIVNIVVSNPVS